MVLCKEIFLSNWTVKIHKKGKVTLEGITKDLGKGQAWKSSIITERVDKNTLRTYTGSVYHLCGPLNQQLARSYGVPEFIISHLKDGFPIHWQALCKNSRRSVKDSNMVVCEQGRLRRCGQFDPVKGVRDKITEDHFLLPNPVVKHSVKPVNLESKNVQERKLSRTKKGKPVEFYKESSGSQKLPNSKLPPSKSNQEAINKSKNNCLYGNTGVARQHTEQGPCSQTVLECARSSRQNSKSVHIENTGNVSACSWKHCSKIYNDDIVSVLSRSLTMITRSSQQKGLSTESSSQTDLSFIRASSISRRMSGSLRLSEHQTARESVAPSGLKNSRKRKREVELAANEVVSSCVLVSKSSDLGLPLHSKSLKLSEEQNASSSRREQNALKNSSLRDDSVVSTPNPKRQLLQKRTEEAVKNAGTVRPTSSRQNDVTGSSSKDHLEVNGSSQRKPFTKKDPEEPVKKNSPLRAVSSRRKQNVSLNSSFRDNLEEGMPSSKRQFSKKNSEELLKKMSPVRTRSSRQEQNVSMNYSLRDGLRGSAPSKERPFSKKNTEELVKRTICKPTVERQPRKRSFCLDSENTLFEDKSKQLSTNRENLGSRKQSEDQCKLPKQKKENRDSQNRSDNLFLEGQAHQPKLNKVRRGSREQPDNTSPDVQKKLPKSSRGNRGSKKQPENTSPNGQEKLPKPRRGNTGSQKQSENTLSEEQPKRSKRNQGSQKQLENSFPNDQEKLPKPNKENFCPQKQSENKFPGDQAKLGSGNRGSQKRDDVVPDDQEKLPKLNRRNLRSQNYSENTFCDDQDKLLRPFGENCGSHKQSERISSGDQEMLPKEKLRSPKKAESSFPVAQPKPDRGNTFLDSKEKLPKRSKGNHVLPKQPESASPDDQAKLRNHDRENLNAQKQSRNTLPDDQTKLPKPRNCNVHLQKLSEIVLSEDETKPPDTRKGNLKSQKLSKNVLSKEQTKPSKSSIKNTCLRDQSNNTVTVIKTRLTRYNKRSEKGSETTLSNNQTKSQNQQEDVVLDGAHNDQKVTASTANAVPIASLIRGEKIKASRNKKSAITPVLKRVNKASNLVGYQGKKLTGVTPKSSLSTAGDGRKLCNPQLELPKEMQHVVPKVKPRKLLVTTPKLEMQHVVPKTKPYKLLVTTPKLVLAGRGTLKRRKQLRDIMKKRHEDAEEKMDCFFPSTAISVNTGQYASKVTTSTPKMHSVFGDTCVTPASIKRKANSSVSDLQPHDQSAKDMVSYKMGKWMKKHIRKEKLEEQGFAKPSSSTPKTPQPNSEQLLEAWDVLKEMDKTKGSETSMDSYFSESEHEDTDAFSKLKKTLLKPKV